MNNTSAIKLSLAELCQATNISGDILIEIVEEGIIEPIGNTPENWQFTQHTVTVAQKATRLHRDLNINWPGIALALSLIEELEQLRNENQHLKRRLQRFIISNDN